MADLKPDAAASGTFTLGGDLTVNRLGLWRNADHR